MVNWTKDGVYIGKNRKAGSKGKVLRARLAGISGPKFCVEGVKRHIFSGNITLNFGNLDKGVRKSCKRLWDYQGYLLQRNLDFETVLLNSRRQNACVCVHLTSAPPMHFILTTSAI